MTEYPIRGVVENQYVGEVECHSGEHSGKQCGVVTYANEPIEVNYTEEGAGHILLHHTSGVCALSLPGDSGGPWYAYPERATSIEIGGNGRSCSEGGLAVNYRLHNALDPPSPILGYELGPYTLP